MTLKIGISKVKKMMTEEQTEEIEKLKHEVHDMHQSFESKIQNFFESTVQLNQPNTRYGFWLHENSERSMRKLASFTSESSSKMLTDMEGFQCSN